VEGEADLLEVVGATRAAAAAAPSAPRVQQPGEHAMMAMTTSSSMSVRQHGGS